MSIGQDSKRGARSKDLTSGKAEGYVYNQSRRTLHIGGRVKFRFYSNLGRELSHRTYSSYKRIPPERRKLVEETNAPSRAVSCSFDTSEAIR